MQLSDTQTKPFVSMCSAASQLHTCPFFLWNSNVYLPNNYTLFFRIKVRCVGISVFEHAVTIQWKHDIYGMLLFLLMRDEFKKTFHKRRNFCVSWKPTQYRSTCVSNSKWNICRLLEYWACTYFLYSIQKLWYSLFCVEPHGLREQTCYFVCCFV